MELGVVIGSLQNKKKEKGKLSNPVLLVMLAPGHANESGDLVWLNVSGTKFCASRATLLQYDDSFFSLLLSGSLPSTRDSSGALFIGRPAHLFSLVLEWLCCGSVELPSGVSEARFLQEMEFYGLAGTMQELDLTKLDNQILQALDAEKQKSEKKREEDYQRFCQENDEALRKLFGRMVEFMIRQAQSETKRIIVVIGESLDVIEKKNTAINWLLAVDGLRRKENFLQDNVAYMLFSINAKFCCRFANEKLGLSVSKLDNYGIWRSYSHAFHMNWDTNPLRDSYSVYKFHAISWTRSD
jgi:hypothetical protein